MTYQLINRSAHDTGLPTESVDCVVTSPPYFGLRAYSGDQGIDWPEVQYSPMPGLPPLTIPAMRCGLGEETTPEAYIGHLMLVMREMWRVLKPTGVVWWNLGDSYNSSPSNMQSGVVQRYGYNQGYDAVGRQSRKITGLKPKDLIGIPGRFFFAAQADGWWIRSRLPWLKRNGMPGSESDRPTQTIEDVFLLAKSERYFYDAEAVKMPVAASSVGRAERKQNLMNKTGQGTLGKQIENGVDTSHSYAGLALGRNGKTGYDIEGGRYFRSSDLFFRSWQGLLSDPDGNPLAFVVNTKGYSGVKLLADYVAPNGTPYIASPDCPIHGHLSRGQTSYTAEYDEQSGHPLSRSPGSDGHPDLSPLDESAAKTCHTNSAVSFDSAPRQMTENNLDSKMSDRPLEHTSGGQTDSRTNRKSSQHEHQDHKTDYSPPEYSQTATERNNQNRKKALAQLTTQPYKPSSEIDNRTDDMSIQPALFALGLDNEECNTLVVSAPDAEDSDLSGQTQFRNADKEISSLPNYTCTCKICKTDHFAVWPQELVEPMIRAGSSQRGVCPSCGRPFVRVVERETLPRNVFVSSSDRGVREPGRERAANGGMSNGSPVTTTTGWEPTCTCGHHGDYLPDDLEVISTPTGERIADDPTLTTGRGGYNRPRGDNEGTRPITRYEQRRYAEQLRNSPHRAEMEAEAGAAFAHYIRTDRSGARPVPEQLLCRWIDAGWIDQVAPPKLQPFEPIPATVLDCFNGSGTTGRAALKLGRSYIGCDVSAEYLTELAPERMSNVQMEMAL